LQAVVGVVGQADGLVKVAVGRHRDHRGEQFLAVDAHVRRRVDQHGRLEHRPFAAPAQGDPGAGGHRLLHLGVGFLRRPRVDHRADLHRRVTRIAELEPGNPLQQQLQRLVVDRAVDQHALHRDAVLPGIGEATDGDLPHGVVDVGILVDDGRRIAAQLQTDALAPGHALEVPADLGATGKGEKLDALVADELLRPRAGADHDTERLRRVTGFQNHLRQEQARKRRVAGWLEDERVAGGNGRAELVAAQVERVVEGRDAQHRPQRQMAYQADPSLAGFRPVNRDDLAADALGLLRRDTDGLQRPADLPTGNIERLAALHL